MHMSHHERERERTGGELFMQDANVQSYNWIDRKKRQEGISDLKFIKMASKLHSTWDQANVQCYYSAYDNNFPSKISCFLVELFPLYIVLNIIIKETE